MEWEINGGNATRNEEKGKESKGGVCDADGDWPTGNALPGMGCRGNGWGRLFPNVITVAMATHGPRSCCHTAHDVSNVLAADSCGFSPILGASKNYQSQQ